MPIFTATGRDKVVEKKEYRRMSAGIIKSWDDGYKFPNPGKA